MTKPCGARPRNRVWVPAGRRDLFLSPKGPDRRWYPPNLLFRCKGGFFAGVKTPEPEADPSPPPNASVKNGWFYTFTLDGFGGLVVTILTTETRVRGFKPDRSRWIFRASGKSSVCISSEGK